MATCKGTRKDGRPCTGKALADGYCFAHSPTLARTRRDGQARGGQNKANDVRAARLMPVVLRPVLQYLLQGLGDVTQGRLEPRRATAMASVATAIVRVYEAGLLEERLRDLEQQHEQSG